jgi:hypothetical protein
MGYGYVMVFNVTFNKQDSGICFLRRTYKYIVYINIIDIQDTYFNQVHTKRIYVYKTVASLLSLYI